MHCTFHLPLPLFSGETPVFCFSVYGKAGFFVNNQHGKKNGSIRERAAEKNRKKWNIWQKYHYPEKTAPPKEEKRKKPHDFLL